MKKITFLFFCTFMLFGCAKNYESELKEIGNNYFNIYVKGKVEGLDKVEITLADLKKIDDIDLSNVKKCNDNTTIIMTIENNRIIDYTIEQDCK